MNYLHIDKKNEIQYENRLLLKKMLQIDLKPSKLNKKVLDNNTVTSKENRNASGSRLSQPSGLNSYTSLNRATRIKDMARIVEDNRVMLQKLQTASSQYSIGKWEVDDKKRNRLVRMICRNSDRF